MEQCVVVFTAKELGLKPGRVQPSSRISEDLGADGDDAVEFFRAFERDFDVNLEPLYRGWDRHFRPEGSGPSLGFLVIAGASAFTGDLLHKAVAILPGWAWMISLTGGSLWVWNRFFTQPRCTTPITVHDLVEAATKREWALPYDEDAAMFRLLE